MTNIMKTEWVKAACGLCIAGLLLAACASEEKAPATADVAVSKAAVSDAAGAGGMQFAPAEMVAARDKLARANKALADKDYKLASELATQAEADAKLAQSKADSGKAEAASNALQEDLHALREELRRANANAAAK